MEFIIYELNSVIIFSGITTEKNQMKRPYFISYIYMSWVIFIMQMHVIITLISSLLVHCTTVYLKQKVFLLLMDLDRLAQNKSQFTGEYKAILIWLYNYMVFLTFKWLCTCIKNNFCGSIFFTLKGIKFYSAFSNFVVTLEHNI